jgi:3-oxoadipate enol-lactonase
VGDNSALISLTQLARDNRSSETILLGAGLGTTSATLWSRVVPLLDDRFELLGVDLPGHGVSPAATNPFTIGDLANEVRTYAGQIAAKGRSVWFVGVSMAGAIAFELARQPGELRGLVALASGPTLGEAAAWNERAMLVRSEGVRAVVPGAPGRWFNPNFSESDGTMVSQMLQDLRETDNESYALSCEALASYDGRNILETTQIAFLLGLGDLDQVVPRAQAEIDVRTGRSVTIHLFRGCAHQPPIEVPDQVAAALSGFAQRLEAQR